MQSISNNKYSAFLIDKKGSILIYAIVLSFFAVMAASALLSKTETIIVQNKIQRVNQESTNNLESQADLSIKFNKAINSDGDGFHDSVVCPNNFQYINVSSGVTLFTTPTVPAYDEDGIFCSGSYTNYGNFRVRYASGYTQFDKVEFAGNTLNLIDGANMTTSPFVGSGALNYQIVFTKTVALSGYDSDGDSDDRKGTSTGTLAYPNGLYDNDAEARLLLFGYIKKDAGFSSVFWSNKKTNDFVSQNPLNGDGIFQKIENIQTGAIYMSIDKPYTLKIYEFDRAKYLENRELYVLSGSTYSSASGAIGYLTPSGAFSGSFGSGTSVAGARFFDFKNKDYAFLLAYSGGTSDFLRYQVRISTATGVSVYMAPLQDFFNGESHFLASDITLDSDGKFISSQSIIKRSDVAGKIQNVSTGSGTNFCNFNTGFFGCLFY